MIWLEWIQHLGPISQKIVKGYCRMIGRPLIEVEYDCGFGNNISMRGELPGLTWEKGVTLYNCGPSCWLWIAPTPCQGAFKLLINDRIYEEGPNHKLEKPEGLKIVPKFNVRG